LQRHLIAWGVVALALLGLHADTAFVQERAAVFDLPNLSAPAGAGGTLHLPVIDRPDSLNPYADLGFAGVSAPLLFGTLLEVDPVTLTIGPGLASSFEVSADLSEITFTLRRDVSWSDGEPFTAADVLFTFNDVLGNPALELDTNAPPLEMVALNERIVRLELPGPLAYELLGPLATTAPILPSHKLADVVAARDPADAFAKAWGVNAPAEEVVGLGPYRLGRVRKGGNPFLGQQVVALELARNPFYWKTDPDGTGLPYADALTLVLVPGEGSALEAFQKGQVDLLRLDRDQAAELAGASDVRLLGEDPAVGVDFLAFNQDAEDEGLRALFRDVRFRRAVAHALDREAMLAHAPELAPFLVPRHGFVHPRLPVYDAEATTRYETDLSQANALLDALGLIDVDGDGLRERPDGRPLGIELITNEGNELRAAAGAWLAERLSEVGLDVTFAPIAFDQLVQRLDLDNREPRYQMLLVRFGADDSPLTDDSVSCLFSSEGGCHLFRFSDAEGAADETQQRLDQLLSELSATPLPEQQAAWSELQRLVSEDLALIPLWSDRITFAARPGIHNAEALNVLGAGAFAPVLWKE